MAKIENAANTAAKTDGLRKEAYNQLPLTRRNFIMMLISGILIVIGFALMVGGGSDDPQVFSDAIFSPVRIIVGPALAFLGFLAMAIAIIIKPKDKKDR